MVTGATVPAGAVHARLLDAAGQPASVGLLEVAVGGEAFGTVCGLSPAAADVVCRQLGFDFGVASTSPCGSYGGSSVCGAAGGPVAMRGLECAGGELGVGECSWRPADASCADHAADAVVFCGHAGRSGRPADGSARLLSHDGAPSLDGRGRLEVFVSGAWTPVCATGFAPGSETVACRAMGFAGSSSPAARPPCGSAFGRNYCGAAAPRLGNLSCSGDEKTLLACAFEEGEDVFCAAEESVVVSCAGDGDAQGRLSM